MKICYNLKSPTVCNNQNFKGLKNPTHVDFDKNLNTKSNEKFPDSYLREQVLYNRETPQNMPAIPEPIAPKEIDIQETFADLIQDGIRFKNDYIGLVRDNGEFVYADNTYYVINIPEDNYLGYSYNAKYDYKGRLVSEHRIETNPNGTTTSKKINFNLNGKPTSYFEETYANGNEIEYTYIDRNNWKGNYIHHKYYYIDKHLAKKESTTIHQNDYDSFGFEEISEVEYIDNDERTILTTYKKPKRKEHTEIRQWSAYKYIQATLSGKNGLLEGIPKSKEEIYKAFKLEKLKDKKYDSIEDLNKKVPDGYYYNSKENKLIKVNKDNLKIEVEGNSENGGIVIYDENGTIIGERYYQRENDDLYFHSYHTGVNGLGIGTLIMDESLKLAKKYGTGITGTADANNPPILGCPKKVTNLKYYYKLGYRAKDKGTDKLIQECIDKGFEIPVILNKRTDTRFVGKNSKIGSGATYIKVSNIKNQHLN